jgi:hypothetical protein
VITWATNGHSLGRNLELDSKACACHISDYSFFLLFSFSFSACNLSLKDDELFFMNELEISASSA